MKRLYANLKNKISNKKGASNLEVIIVMSVALVIGAALFLVGNELSGAAKSARGKGNQMGTTINATQFDTLS